MKPVQTGELAGKGAKPPSPGPEGKQGNPVEGKQREPEAHASTGEVSTAQGPDYGERIHVQRGWGSGGDLMGFPCFRRKRQGGQSKRISP